MSAIYVATYDGAGKLFKVGRTDRDDEDERIAEWGRGTGVPMTPKKVLSLRFRGDSLPVEQAIHDALKNRRTEGGGQEWFKVTIKVLTKIIARVVLEQNLEITGGYDPDQRFSEELRISEIQAEADKRERDEEERRCNVKLKEIGRVHAEALRNYRLAVDEYKQMIESLIEHSIIGGKNVPWPSAGGWFKRSEPSATFSVQTPYGVLNWSKRTSHHAFIDGPLPDQFYKRLDELRDHGWELESIMRRAESDARDTQKTKWDEPDSMENRLRKEWDDNWVIGAFEKDKARDKIQGIVGFVWQYGHRPGVPPNLTVE